MKKTNPKQKNFEAFAKEKLSKTAINKIKGGDDPKTPPVIPPPPSK